MKHLATDPDRQALENWGHHRQQVLEPVHEVPNEYGDELLVSKLCVLTRAQFLGCIRIGVRIVTANGLDTRAHTGDGDFQWDRAGEYAEAIEQWGGDAAGSTSAGEDLQQQLADARQQLIAGQVAVSEARAVITRASAPVDFAAALDGMTAAMRADSAIVGAWRSILIAAATKAKAPPAAAETVANEFMAAAFGIEPPATTNLPGDSASSLTPSSQPEQEIQSAAPGEQLSGVRTAESETVGTGAETPLAAPDNPRVMIVSEDQTEVPAGFQRVIVPDGVKGTDIVDEAKFTKSHFDPEGKPYHPTVLVPIPIEQRIHDFVAANPPTRLNAIAAQLAIEAPELLKAIHGSDRLEKVSGGFVRIKETPATPEP